MNEEKVFEDPTLPAFFEATNLPVTILPRFNHDTRMVEFAVSSEYPGTIDGGIQDYYNGIKVPAVQLIRSLKELRSAIFYLKRGRS